MSSTRENAYQCGRFYFHLVHLDCSSVAIIIRDLTRRVNKLLDRSREGFYRGEYTGASAMIFSKRLMSAPTNRFALSKLVRVSSLFQMKIHMEAHLGGHSNCSWWNPCYSSGNLVQQMTVIGHLHVVLSLYDIKGGELVCCTWK